MDKVLGILCHPDDEVLFGWPIFQSNEFEKYLIILCDDYVRRGPQRRQALQKVCQQENINLVKCLSENNNFYSLPTRRPNLLKDAIKRIELTINAAIKNIKPDFIFTHSVQGDYGHGSHRLLFQLVSQNNLVKNLIITDINQVSNHWSYEEIPNFIWHLYYLNNIWRSDCVLDQNFYNRCKQIYDKYNSWTWSKDPIEQCNLYLLKEEK